MLQHNPLRLLIQSYIELEPYLLSSANDKYQLHHHFFLGSFAHPEAQMETKFSEFLYQQCEWHKCRKENLWKALTALISPLVIEEYVL